MRRTVSLVALTLALTLAFTLIGCQASKPKTVWDNLGGEASVRKVVDDFVARSAPDANVNFFRRNVSGYPEWKPTDAQVAHMKEKLVELISSGTGGPYTYSGRAMKPLHTGMKITSAEFSALAVHLDAALRAGGAKDADRAAVMAFAASTMTDIVEVK